MKKPVAVLLMAAVLLLSGCGLPGGSSSVPPPPESTGEKSVADYFPVRADTRMTYKGFGSEYAGFVSTVDYIGAGTAQLRTHSGGAESVAVYTVGTDTVTKVFTKDALNYRYDFTDQRALVDVLVMAPLAVGTAWKSGAGEERSITALDAAVSVPYGSFKALEVTTASLVSGTVKEYYAPGVGLVKRVCIPAGDPASPVTSELEKFEDGSPLKEDTRFYYPDIINDRVAYIDKTVTFHTGDTAASRLEAEFKNPPQGSGLTPVMTAGAALNGITVDAGSGAVTADLSKSFVTEMNAGTALEALILASLADTLGNYFHTDKVAVTIDGGPYESTHLLFNLGDFLPVHPEKAVSYQK
ncbi:Sporulation and spore germination [Sporobacter termitidis DSM 10068]|uniref:Sporulation and spore germination n=1 Tax=Sporobacter termitidis DSM 10068 TaxID=1123282 RepID=A0A1M5YW54_9FIRM|nr:GerMN domain-containing protein [Sporobacter termitidis]SHI16094.1 Sporulation and spore germination [Sporobacter termitidis DSM 10068]